MKMTRIEKWFVNRSQHAGRTVKRVEKLLSSVNVKGKQDFLEVGCGSGAVCRYVAQKYLLNATGIDVDAEQIQLAQESTGNMPNIRFLEADATNLPFQDDGFDLVLSFGVMHHISNWLDALAEIKRVLKPGGYFIYADLVYPRVIAKIGKSLNHNYGVTTTHDLNLFIEENDFSIIRASSSKSLIWNNYEAVYQKN